MALSALLLFFASLKKKQKSGSAKAEVSTWPDQLTFLHDGD